MWKSQPTDVFKGKLIRLTKNRPKEMENVIRNLSTYFAALDEGVNPIQIQVRFRFVHNERNGIYAVDQRGGPKNLAETRLYLFPHVPSETLYLLTIGDKNSQPRDINDCRAMVKEIKTSEETRNERASEPEPTEDESEIQ